MRNSVSITFSIISMCVGNLFMAVPAVSFAADVPQSFTLDGQLFSDAAGTAPLLDSAIDFKVQILDEDKICIVYEETQSVSTIAAKGYFTVQIGTELGSPKRTAGDSANSMATVFQNIALINGKLASNGSPCTVPPLSAKRRYVRITIAPASMGSTARVLSPELTIDSVPNAIVAERAESLQGLRGTDVLKVNSAAGSALTQSNLESLFTSTTRFNSLSAMVDGTSTTYMRTNSSSGAQLPVLPGAPTMPPIGSIWFDSSDSKLKYQTSVGPSVVGSGGGSVTSVGLTAPSELSVTGAPITTSGTIAMTWANQTTNKVFAAPDGSTGAPTFRALTVADLPRFSIGDLKTSTGTQQFAGSTACTASQTLTWSSLTDTFTCTNIAALDAGAITTGTIANARLPASATAWTVAGADAYRSAGSVGIGTSSPTAYLHVKNTSGTGSIFTAEGASGTSFSVDGYGNSYFVGGMKADFDTGLGQSRLSGNGDHLNLTTTTAGKHILLRPAPGGYVGIGTTSPNSQLHIANTNDAVDTWLQFTNNQSGSTAGDGLALGVQPGTNDAYLWNSENASIVFGTNGTPRFHIEGSGNVGIGTVAPSEKLDVTGNLRVQGQAYSAAQSSSATSPLTFNADSGNVMSWSAAAQTDVVVNLNNAKDGGSYTLAIRGTAAGTTTINCSSDNGVTLLTNSFMPSNADRAANASIYTILRVGNYCYISWSTGWP